jgi:Ca2+-binding RTX toxin-like protein
MMANASTFRRHLFTFGSCNGITKRRTARRQPLALEVLEDRSLLSISPVTDLIPPGGNPGWIENVDGVVAIHGINEADGAMVSYVSFPGGPVSPAPTPWLRVSLNNSFGLQVQYYFAPALQEIQFYGHDGDDLFQNNTWIPSYAEGGADQDQLAGGFGSDTLHGGAGHDAIHGNAGNDVLYGGAGNDLMTGGQGYDYFEAGSGADVLQGGNEDDHLIGEAGDDVLQGGSGDDILEGGAGSDWLGGGSGRDLLVGGFGQDTLHGGPGEDILLGGEINFLFGAQALEAIWDEWNSGRSYTARILNIRGVNNPEFANRANGNFFLQQGSTVLDDGAPDELYGEGDRDWFLPGPFDVTDQVPGEVSDC